MVAEDSQSAVTEPAAAARVESRLRAQVEALERRLRERDEQRRAMLHIMGDLNEFNKRLANQRKAMLHILADYEQDRRRLARQTDRLDKLPPGALRLPLGLAQLNLQPSGCPAGRSFIFGGP